MGTPIFAVSILEAIIANSYEVVCVVTQPDRPKGRKKLLTPSPVKKLALEHQLPIFQPKRLQEEYELLLEMNADIIVTAAYGQILPTELLENPKFGSINVHASLLPELRGGAPIHHAIIQGKKETGITIMYMVDRLDAGDMISQKKIPITMSDDVGILHDKLAELGANLLIETLPDIFNRTNKQIPQDESKATFAYNITREDEKIDWSQSYLEVYNQIRGLHPWPGAYTMDNGTVTKIWSATLTEETYSKSKPGTIVAIEDNQYLVIACGDHCAVKIETIQVAGKKKMSVKDYLLGNPQAWEVGQILE